MASNALAIRTREITGLSSTAEAVAERLYNVDYIVVTTHG